MFFYRLLFIAKWNLSHHLQISIICKYPTSNDKTLLSSSKTIEPISFQSWSGFREFCCLSLCANQIIHSSRDFICSFGRFMWRHFQIVRHNSSVQFFLSLFFYIILSLSFILVLHVFQVSDACARRRGKIELYRLNLTTVVLCQFRFSFTAVCSLGMISFSLRHLQFTNFKWVCFSFN